LISIFTVPLLDLSDGCCVEAHYGGLNFAFEHVVQMKGLIGVVVRRKNPVADIDLP
jgi:hypothetical protein